MEIGTIKQGALLLIIAGGVFIIIGVFWYFGGKNVPIGRLPWDIAIEKGNFRLYFPLATSILISLVLTLIFWLWYIIKTH